MRVMLRNNIAQLATQNTSAFVSPSAALYFSRSRFPSRHISKLYHIPTVLSCEIGCVGMNASAKPDVHSDGFAIQDTESIVAATVSQ